MASPTVSGTNINYLIHRQNLTIISSHPGASNCHHVFQFLHLQTRSLSQKPHDAGAPNENIAQNH